MPNLLNKERRCDSEELFLCQSELFLNISYSSLISVDLRYTSDKQCAAQHFQCVSEIHQKTDVKGGLTFDVSLAD